MGSNRLQPQRRTSLPFCAAPAIGIDWATTLRLAVLLAVTGKVNAQNPCTGDGVSVLDSGDVYLGELQNNQDCTWRLSCSDATLSPMLTFSTFHTESNFDFLYLYDGDTAEGNPTVTLHGTSLPDAFTATGPAAVARYQSDGSVLMDGFTATLSCVDNSNPAAPPQNPCTGDGVSVLDSGDVYLGELQNNQDCTWRLSCSDATLSPMLTFSTFHTESNFDFLYLYDGDTAEGNPTVTLHGTSLPDAFTATGPAAVARYQSDGSVLMDGFTATLSCVDNSNPAAPPQNPCTGDGVSVLDSGDVYLGELQNNQDCTWRLSCSDATLSPMLTFSTFHTESNFDFLYLYDGDTAEGNPTVTLHGTSLPDAFTATGPAAVARYQSDGSVLMDGFTATLSCVDNSNPAAPPQNPCTGDGVSVLDSGDVYLGELQNNQDCTWRLSCSDATLSPMLTFSTFHTESNYDFLYLYDGDTAEGNPTVTLHGTSLPDAFTATGPAAVARYQSDGSVLMDGFTATLSCVDNSNPAAPPQNPCTGDGVSVLDSGDVYLGELQNNQDCTWRLSCSDATLSPMLTFSTFHTESNFDFLYLYDGDTAEGNPTVTLHGTSLPDAFTATGPAAVARYQSDGSVLMDGFTATLSCVDNSNPAAPPQNPCTGDGVSVLDSGDVYLGELQNNQDCTWRLSCSDATLSPMLTFSTFHTESNFDFLYLYDGDTAEGNPTVTLHGTSLPDAFTATGPAAVARYQSDGSVLMDGFTATLSCVDNSNPAAPPQNPCTGDGVSVLDSGDVYLGELQNNQDCTWRLSCSDATLSPMLTFSTFHTESNFDFLYLYDGDTAEGNPTVTLHGTSLPDAFTATGPAAVARYQSDGSVLMDGFTATLSCVDNSNPAAPPQNPCTGDGVSVLDSGDVYLGELQNNQDCTWRLSCSDATLSPMLTFSTFHTESNFDFLYLYDGDTAEGNPTVTLHGTSLPDAFTATGPAAVARYQSDGSVLMDGFTATLSCVDNSNPAAPPQNPCTGDGVSVLDSGDVYLGELQNNQDCTWRLSCSDATLSPMLTFSTFHTESNFDFLYLYDGDTAEGNPTVTLHGTSLPDAFTATGPAAVARYQSDGSVLMDGFTATLSCVDNSNPAAPPQNPCTGDGVSVLDSGDVYLGELQNNQDCTWRLSCSDATLSPMLTFSTFHTESNYDFLYLYDGDTAEGNPTVTLHGTSLPDAFTATGPAAVARYQSDGSVLMDGFTATLSCVDNSNPAAPPQNPCTGDGVSVLDSGDVYLGELQNNQDCTWRLSCSDATLSPMLTFSTFHTESNFDFLYLYDGDTAEGNPTVTLHGTSLPDAFTATGPAAVARYQSDGSVLMDGFTATLSCVDNSNPAAPPQNPCTGDGVSVLDSGDVYLGELQNNQDCTWRLSCSDATLSPMLTFSTFHTESNYDFLYLYDGDTAEGNPTVTLHGTSLPDAFTATGPAAVARYQSDGSVLMDGFTATLSCVDNSNPAAPPQNPCTGDGVSVLDSGDVYLGELQNNQDCTWRLSCSDATLSPMLTFSTFHTESNFDFLYLYDGDTAEGNPTVTLHGTSLPDAFTATGPAAVARYQSDGSVLMDGFTATLSCVDNSNPAAPPQNPCTGDGVSVLDSGDVYLGELQNNQDCTWRLSCSDATLSPMLTFSTFHTESNFDFLYLYDGDTAEGNPTVTLHGTSLPDAFTATGSAAVARYQSDGSVLMDGFTAALSCVDSSNLAVRCPDGMERSLNSCGCAPCGPGTAGTDGTCLPCSPGTEPSPELTACTPCPSGYISAGIRCARCGATEFTVDGVQCIAAMDGSHPTLDQNGQTACPARSAGIDGMCNSCLAGAVPNDNRTACVPCPRYTYMHPDGEICDRCPSAAVPNRMSGATLCISCSHQGSPEMDAALYENADWEACTLSVVTCEAGWVPNEAQTTCEQCLAGQTWQAATLNDTSKCVNCPAGRADLDLDSTTGCAECSIGTYSDIGTSSCIACMQGQIDEDSNASTPCTLCPVGTEWLVPDNAAVPICTECSVGQADEDSDSTTACTACPVLTYAAAGATQCTLCSASGQYDDDRDPSTPCTDTNTCIQTCDAGFQDDDCDERTVCTRCADGEYSPGGTEGCSMCAAGTSDEDADPASPCTPCAPGFAAGEAHVGPCTSCEAGLYAGEMASECTNCTAGSSDSDSDATTPCTNCEAGFAAAEGHSGPCDACSVGQFADASAAACADCHAGKSDHDSQPDTPCASCLAGFYAEPGTAGSCNACPAGRYSPVSGGENLHICDACLAGSYSNNGSSSCSFCPGGTADVDSNPATECEECPVGTYSGCSETECNVCTAGQIDSDSNPATPCTMCLAGQTWQAATLNDTSKCVNCPAGRADLDLDSTTGCAECSIGTYSDIGTSSCIACMQGQIDEDSNASTPCTLCPVGTEWLVPDNAAVPICTECSVGQADEDSDSTTACTACPVLTYAAAGATQCTLCSASGQYDDDRDPSTPCTDTNTCIQTCDAGFQDDDCDERTVCTRCADGEYSPGGTEGCSMCAAGTSDEDADPASPCTPCAPGFAAGEAHVGPCTSCEAGLYAGEMASECTNCTAGSSDSDSDATTPCTNCEAGFAAAEGHSGPCDACSVGQFADASAAACADCHAGKSDHDSQPDTPCASCLAGFYAEPGTAGSCNACPAGRYSPVSGGENLHICDACLAGSYSNNGSSSCSFCPGGTADVDSNPATECEECPVGTYSGCSETECNVCTAGQIDSDSNPATPCTMCLAGTTWVNVTACIKCAAGKADADSDSVTACVDCVVGEYCSEATSNVVVCADSGQSDHDSDPSTPCRADQGVAVQADVTLDIDIAAISPGSAARTQFETEFAADMATILGVERSRIQIDSIGGGSVVVQFSVLPSPDGVSLPASELVDAFSAGPVAIAGTNADQLSPPTTARYECTQHCQPGFHDTDCDNSTACVACLPGEYGAGGVSPVSLCDTCHAGFTDEDFDSRTECTACTSGRYAAAVGQSGQCIGCPPGRYTPARQGTSVDVCDQCGHGQYSEVGSSSCVFCSSGKADEDLNASTPCTDCSSGTYSGCGETVCAVCAPGQVDSDSSADTPCTACAPGQYWQAPTALNLSTCIQCEAGRADADIDSTTGCMHCESGKYAAPGSTLCTTCASLGQIDHDLNPATPCVTPGTQCTQFCPPGFGDNDCNASTTCVECDPGKYRAIDGTGECALCPPGTYEPLHGSVGCNNTCDASDGIQCAQEGMAYPVPRFGFYMISDEIGVGIEGLAACVPPQACQGGRYGQDNCAPGYGDVRCSRCLDQSEVADDEDPNGYYRKEGVCEPCGKIIPVWILAVAGVVGFVVVALMADKLLMRVSDVSNFIAPLLILMTFFQTLALLLRFSLAWPESLKDLMNKLSIFNINLELARPECSIKWTASSKLSAVLYVPFGGMLLIACYGMAGFLAQRNDHATRSKHLLRKCESMAVGMFMIGSSFFLKGVFGGIDCTPDPANGRYYLDIQPSIECDRSLPEYEEVFQKAVQGIAIWLMMCLAVTTKFLSAGGKYRYSFLTTKLEDRWFWWELFLLARKIAIMASGLFNTGAPARGWFLGTMVVIFSLAAHAYARPFKVDVVDATEFVSLLSTLVIFQSGMVWNSSMDESGLLSAVLESVSILLVLLVCTLGIVAQVVAIQENDSDPYHYSAMSIRKYSYSAIIKLATRLGVDLTAVDSRIEEIINEHQNMPWGSMDPLYRHQMQKLLLDILLKDPEKVEQLQEGDTTAEDPTMSVDERTAGKKKRKDAEKKAKGAHEKQKEAEEWLNRHDFTHKQIKAVQELLPDTLAFDVQLFQKVNIRQLRVAVLAYTLPDLMAELTYNGRCGIWIGNKAEDLLDGIHQLDDVPTLQKLLAQEKMRQRRLQRQKQSTAIATELKRRLYAEEIIQSPLVQELQQNKAKAEYAAIKLAAELVTNDELEAVKQALQSVLDDLEGSRSLWNQMCNNDIDVDSSARMDSDYVEMGNPLAKDDRVTMHNPLEGDDSKTVDIQTKLVDDSLVTTGTDLGHWTSTSNDSATRVRALIDQLTELEQNMQNDAQTVKELSAVAERVASVLNTATVATMWNHPNEVIVEKVDIGKKGWRHREKMVLRITSLKRGPGSRVTVDKESSGPNALGLLVGDDTLRQPAEQAGRFTRQNKGQGHGARCESGSCTGTGFTPFDFRKGQNEKLVFVVDEDPHKRHEVLLKRNVKSIDCLLDILHAQSWVRRSADDHKTTHQGEVAADAKLIAAALVHYLQDCDPVSDAPKSRSSKRRNKSSRRCGVQCGSSKIPVPLRTNAAIRRVRRFNAALITIENEIKFRLEDESFDEYTAAMHTAYHSYVQQSLVTDAYEVVADMKTLDTAYESTADVQPFDTFDDNNALADLYDGIR